VQGSTHLVMGVLIQKILKNVKSAYLRYFLTALLAFISHGVLDKLARFTYHPPNPLFGDLFWTVYHLIIVLLSVFIIIKYWDEYKIGMIFSMLPDLDWVILHTSSFFSLQKTIFQYEPIFHNIFNLLDFIPPFKYFNSLPDLSLRWEGAVLESGVLLILIFLIHVVDGRTKTTN